MVGRAGCKESVSNENDGSLGVHLRPDDTLK